MDTTPAVWFPTVRCGSGTDVFTERLGQALNARGILAEITWLPHRAEYAPWSVKAPKAPFWANVVHINSWLPKRFVPANLPLVVTLHSCVHDPALTPYKSFPSRLEGLPLTVIEAMACGLPVIAAASSSLPEVVQDGASGMLCPLDDVDAFVQECPGAATNRVSRGLSVTGLGGGSKHQEGIYGPDQ